MGISDYMLKAKAITRILKCSIIDLLQFHF